MERKLNDLSYKDSKTRIQEFVMDYLKEFGEDNQGGGLVANNFLSHKDIANLTNNARQTVSNTLSSMRKLGVIYYNSNYISDYPLNSKIE